MAEIRKLQINDTDIAPVTHESAVLDNDGVSLPDKYVTKGQLQNELDKIGNVDTSAIDKEINNLKSADTTINNNITTINNSLTTMNNNLTTMQNSINAVQQIHYSTSEPTSSQGKNGDIWVVYKN